MQRYLRWCGHVFGADPFLIPRPSIWLQIYERDCNHVPEGRNKPELTMETSTWGTRCDEVSIYVVAS